MKSTENSQVTTAKRGLSVAEKQQFVLSTLPALAQHTFPFLCSVIGVVDSKKGKHYGSALRCMLNGRRAILTAQHVVIEAEKEAGGIAITTGYGELPYVVNGEVNIDKVGDLAVYFLADDYPLPEQAFWLTVRIDRDLNKLSTDYLFLHGFPGKSSYSSQLLNGVINKSLPYGAMQRLENLPVNLQPWQFAIEYDPPGMMNETGAAEDMIAPHGLSGSPVWRIGVSGRSSREWTAEDCLLVGIVTHWAQAEKVLIATSTQQLPSTW